MLPSDAATLARSVLSCAAGVTLRVDHQRRALADDDYSVASDVHGSPVLGAPDGSALLTAAEAGAGVVVEVTSGLGPPGCADRDLDLFLQGRLSVRGAGCGCCGDDRALVGVEVERVTLFRADRPHPVDLDRYRDAALVLNAGHLQRATEHANEAHEAELRAATAATFGIALPDLLTASLRRIDPDGVDLAWLDATGAHVQRLDFVRTVSSPAELGTALRTHLHAGLC